MSGSIIGARENQAAACLRPRVLAMRTVLLMGLLTAVTIPAGIAATGAPAGQDRAPGALPSKAGRYLVSYESALEPIPINRMHHWILAITDSAGAPITDASIVVDGGMPAHNHGLATEPRMTEDLGGGRYRIDGLRFHMGGRWVVRVTITGSAGEDEVEIPLRL